MKTQSVEITGCSDYSVMTTQPL